MSPGPIWIPRWSFQYALLPETLAGWAGSSGEDRFMPVPFAFAMLLVKVAPGAVE